MPEREKTEKLLCNDCTLELDNSSFLEKKTAVKKEIKSKAQQILVFARVHVIYRGGNMSGIDSVQFNDCTFASTIRDTPPNPASLLTTQLLAADQIANISVTFSKS